MQPNLQPNMQPGVAGTQLAYNGVPMNSGVNMGNQYGMAGLGTAGQYGQGLGTGTTPSMSQNIGNNAGPPMGHPGVSDMGTNMVHGLGSGMGQNMMQSMGSNMPMGAPNMGGAQPEAQAGLAPALGQGMGISEGFPCVKLRGLPFDANEQDIAVWLETEPLDIIIVRRGQRSTGEAYILLRMPIQVELVLRKDKTYIGKRYVEVNLAKKLDFYKAVYAMVRDDAESSGMGPHSYERQFRDYEHRHSRHDSPPRRRHSSRERSSRDPISRHRSTQDSDSNDFEDHLLPSQRNYTGVLKMRGLPFAATPEDIVYWFNSAGLPIQAITSESVRITTSGGKPTGNGYVKFATSEESKLAMAKDRKTLGSRYIELFPCSQAEWSEAT
ncbi:hypothetical protein ABBQ38_014244 [Trebouxia sp. C0009 RCD-2024]